MTPALLLHFFARFAECGLAIFFAAVVAMILYDVIRAGKRLKL